ncbi:MAG: hypothetical protein JXB04_01750 [Kiritimatiellae bacterium]|nr:hypothetical protein [Kiritimatiellia bacterium]
MFYRTSVSYDTAARVAADQAKARADHVREEADLLRLDNERLLMITEALWGIIKEQHELTDDELFKRVVEIDLRDGRLDGKVAAKEPPKCPHCGRPLPRRRPMCIYCGKPVKMDVFQR